MLRERWNRGGDFNFRKFGKFFKVLYAIYANPLCKLTLIPNQSWLFVGI